MLEFEVHVTIEPPTEELRVAAFKRVAERNGFRVAKLQMHKGRLVHDFCTGHAETYERACGMMTGVTKNLAENGFTVRRYKIEQVLFDSRRGDGNA